jgi:hypothetical protein
VENELVPLQNLTSSHSSAFHSYSGFNFLNVSHYCCNIAF